jgi:hypothetical protein
MSETLIDLTETVIDGAKIFGIACGMAVSIGLIGAWPLWAYYLTLLIDIPNAIIGASLFPWLLALLYSLGKLQ